MSLRRGKEIEYVSDILFFMPLLTKQESKKMCVGHNLFFLVSIVFLSIIYLSFISNIIIFFF